MCIVCDSLSKVTLVFPFLFVQILFGEISWIVSTSVVTSESQQSSWTLRGINGGWNFLFYVIIVPSAPLLPAVKKKILPVFPVYSFLSCTGL